MFIFEQVSATRTERRVLCAACCPGKGAPEAIGRLNREAPLVRLVNEVPEGLDPIGWRAAVLAVAELLRMSESAHTQEFWRAWPRCVDAIETAARTGRLPEREGTAHRAACQYLRALTPSPKVAPFVRRAPGLPLDIDYD